MKERKITVDFRPFLLTPLREGRRSSDRFGAVRRCISTHAPAGGATRACSELSAGWSYFYSRPCGRGDFDWFQWERDGKISTHAPAGGATIAFGQNAVAFQFLLTPLREGRLGTLNISSLISVLFLLTPLREGRLKGRWHSPISPLFLLTPLREGRHKSPPALPAGGNFYSRPCGRGDLCFLIASTVVSLFLLTPLREGRRTLPVGLADAQKFLLTPLREGRPEDFAAPDTENISTHAPAGGATEKLSPCT